MSRFSGPQGTGAMRTHREKKRREAEERQAKAELVTKNTFTRRRKKSPKGKRGKKA